MKKVLVSLIIAASVGMAYSQEKIKGLPEDLDSHKIIFLAWEPLPITDNLDKKIKKMYMNRNEASETANKQLEEGAAQYPFEYIIVKRSEYEDIVAKGGYKYVLDCEMMESYYNGVNMYAGKTRNVKKTYVSDLYIKDVTTGDKYVIGEQSQTFVYFYKGIMQSLNKMIKKEYKK